MKWSVTAFAILFLASGVVFISCGGDSASDHYQRGSVAAQEGDWEKARQEFDAANSYNDAKQRAVEAQRNSATVAAAYGKAKDAISNEKWSEAYSQLQIVLGLSPKYKDASNLLVTVTARLDDLYNAAAAAQESGDFAKAIDGFAAAGDYKDSADRLATVSRLQTELATLYGSMKQYESTKDFAKAAETAAAIIKRAPTYRDVASLVVGYKEQLYAQSSDLLAQHKLRQALQGFQALAAVDPNFKDVHEKIGQTQTLLKTAQPGTREFNLSKTNVNSINVTLVSIEVLADGQMRVNVRVRNNSSAGYFWTVTADGSIYILDEDSNRYVPTGWGTAGGPRQLVWSDEILTQSGQELELYVMFPALKDASKIFSFTDDVTFEGLSIVP